MRRRFHKASLEVDKSLDHARRLGIEDLPDFDPSFYADSTYYRWREHWETTLNEFVLGAPFHPDVLPEAFKRGAQRLAPSEDGNMRDAVIWLSLIYHMRKYPVYGEIAFVSSDGDFCSTDPNDERVLHSQLIDDANRCNISVDFYPSLRDFNIKYAEPFGIYTEEWVYQQISESDISEQLAFSIRQELNYYQDQFEIADLNQRSFYEPVIYHGTYAEDWEIKAIHAWEVNGPNDVILEVVISCEAFLEADCNLTVLGPIMGGFYDSLSEDELKPTKTLNCSISCDMSLGLRFANEMLELRSVSVLNIH